MTTRMPIQRRENSEKVLFDAAHALQCYDLKFLRRGFEPRLFLFIRIG